MSDDVVIGERARRRAMNEALFREVNERIRDVNESFADFANQFSIVCECDDAACLDRISIAPERYEAIRADATLFAVRPSHDTPAVETVEEERGEYWVVRKKPGDPTAVAAATDPRLHPR